MSPKNAAGRCGRAIKQPPPRTLVCSQTFFSPLDFRSRCFFLRLFVCRVPRPPSSLLLSSTLRRLSFLFFFLFFFSLLLFFLSLPFPNRFASSHSTKLTAVWPYKTRSVVCLNSSLFTVSSRQQIRFEFSWLFDGFCQSTHLATSRVVHHLAPFSFLLFGTLLSLNFRSVIPLPPRRAWCRFAVDLNLVSVPTTLLVALCLIHLLGLQEDCS